MMSERPKTNYQCFQRKNIKINKYKIQFYMPPSYMLEHTTVHTAQTRYGL